MKHTFSTWLSVAILMPRYKHDYVITQDELTALIERVKTMQQVVEGICREKIALF